MDSSLFMSEKSVDGLLLIPLGGGEVLDRLKLICLQILHELAQRRALKIASREPHHLRSRNYVYLDARDFLSMAQSDLSK
ncbi:MAG: hypothetical protein EBV34_15840 [Betaproteobacteria bacterium]|nr:hypothetical protein [Betaproteobacteria bacterium]